MSGGHDPLDLLIAAGWGDVAQPRIPAEVRRAAEEGGPVPACTEGISDCERRRKRAALISAWRRRNVPKRREKAA